MTSPLPRGLPPVAGESFASYVDRLAARYDVPLGVMLRRIGIYDGQERSLVGYGTVVPDERVAELSSVLGLSDQTVLNMLPTAFLGGAIPAMIDTDDPPQAMRRLRAHWIYLHGSHFCPHCLREDDGAWQLCWRLPWSFACVRHSAVLVDECPGCGHRPISGGAWSRPANFRRQVPIPGHCSNRQRVEPNDRGARRHPCGFDLTMASAQRVISWPSITAAQAAIDARLEDVGASTAMWFRDLRAVASLLMCYSEPLDLLLGPPALHEVVSSEINNRKAFQEFCARQRAAGVHHRLRTYQTIPQSASFLACALTEAVSILDAEDVTGLADNLGHLAQRIREAGRSPSHVPHAYIVSDDLASAFDIAAARSGSFSLRTGLHPSAPREDLGHRIALGPQHVPQLLWQEAFDARFADLFPDAPATPARAFCSICLVKLLERCSWKKAATYLELHGAHQAMVFRIQRQLSDAGREHEYRTRLRALALDFASQRPLVDFAARRRQFADLRDLPDDLWRTVCVSAGVACTRSGGRRLYATAWVWSQVTGGDPMRSPALSCASPAVRRRWSRFIACDLPRMTPALERAASQLVLTGRKA